MASQSIVTRHETLLQEFINSLKTWKGLIDNNLQGEEREFEMGLLEEIARDYSLIVLNNEACLKACQEVAEAANNESGDANVDIDALFKEKLASKDYTPNTLDYKQHRIWKEVFSGGPDRDVEEVEEQPSTSLEPSQYEQLQDSEIFCSNVFTPPVDPISKMVIKEPYKSKTCGHIYEYKFILSYIKSMKDKAKCPYMGCGNRNLTVAQLEQDTETQQKIKDYKETNTKESQSSSDNDD